jgi:hypothetical protein
MVEFLSRFFFALGQYELLERVSDAILRAGPDQLTRGERALVMRWYVVLSLLALPTLSIAGSPSKPADLDKAPSDFQVWSENANQSITASCSPKEDDPHSISCDFIQVLLVTGRRGGIGQAGAKIG